MSNEKNQTKNKVMKYVIEVIVLLAIGVAAFYGISKINTSVTKSNQKTVVLTMEAQGLEGYIIDKIDVGDRVADNVKTTSFGEIKSVTEKRPYTRAAANYTDMKIVQSPVEGFYTKDIVVEVKADITDLTIMAGETELKIGYTIPLISDEYVASCLITDIKIKD